MQNQSNTSSNGFTLMPMGAQQFYQMAQQHAMANATFAPSVPAYLPLSEPELYSSMMSFGAYTMPQNMMQQQASMEAYQTEQSYQGFGFGVGSAVAPSSTVPTVATAESYLMASPYDLPSRSYASSSAYHIPMSPIPAAPLPSAQREKEGAFPSDRDAAEHISDAPFADEHKWRKYGQKQVKRSPYPRNYYKCTVPGCPAKKHLEKFWDTSSNRERCRTIYIGEHVHPVAASPQVFAATQLDFQNNVLAQSSRIRTASPHASEADVAAQQRLVVECGVNVDENEDGYYWRKYGQKSVKGSLTPRQYYRCRVANCQVKKTVEASPKGSTIVTYEGCHCHEPGMHAPTQAALLDSSPVSPASILSSARSSLSASPNPAAAATVVPAFRLSIKQEEIQPVHFSAAFSVQYPAVDSPSSTFSTTDEEDESYLSEPSPKRSFKDEDVAASYDNAFHQFAPDAPSADAWYWDSNHHSELLSQ